MKYLLIALMLISFNALAGDTEYQQGYEDGCQSGKADYLHPFKKDVDRYIKDDYYKTGWQDGFRRCEAEYKAINDAVKQGFGF